MKICAVGIVFLSLLGWGLRREAIIEEHILQRQIGVVCPAFWAELIPLDAKTEATLRTVCLKA